MPVIYINNDDIRLNSSSSDKVVVTGSLGIGTTSPAYKLSVNGDASFGSYIYIASEGSGGVIGDISTGNYLRFLVSNSERMRLTSSGNVGINNTTPLSRLQVSDSVSGDAGITIHNNTEATGNTAAIWFKEAGSPSDYRKGGIFFRNDGTGHGRGDFYFSLNQAANSAVATTADARMVIRNSGNVGIGTTSPEQKLTIQGGVNNVWSFSTNTSDQPGFIAADNTTFGTATNILYLKQYGSALTGTIFGNSIASKSIVASDGSASTGLIVGTFNAQPLIVGTNNSERMRITSAGNVGIGTTSPSSGSRLQVEGNIFSNNVGGNSFSINSAGANYGFILNNSANTFSLGYGPSLGTVGSSVLTWNSLGNVGIGTTSPGAKLQVNSDNLGGTAGDQSIQSYFFNNNGNTSFLEIKDVRTSTGADWTFAAKRIQMRIDSTYMGYVQFNGTGNNAGISFGAGTTTTAPGNVSERMRITEGGNVGIGTTAPSRKLTVSNPANGDVALFTNTIDADLLINLTSGVTLLTPSTGTLAFGTSLTEKMRITSAGNIGIGTTSPFGTAANRTVLSVNGTTDVSLNVGTSGAQRAYLYGSSTYAELGTIGALPLTLATDNNEKMRITSAGNVGIGTTTANTLLSIDGKADDGISIQGIGTTATRAFFGLDTSGDGYLSLTNGGTFAKNVQLTSDLGVANYIMGNVGIGTTSPESTSRLHIYNGSAAAKITLETTDSYESLLNFSSATNEYSVGFNKADNTFRIANANSLSSTVRMVINSSGNVGIGTTSPTAKLTVSGTGAETHINNGDTNALVLGGFNSGRHFIKSINLGVAITPLTLQASSFTFDTGSVGIGTTSPTHKLQVVGPGTFASTATAINGNVGLYMTIGGSANNYNGILFQGVSVADMYFGRAAGAGVDDLIIFGGGELVRFKQNGNVGIGTTSPSYKLQAEITDATAYSPTNTLSAAPIFWAYNSNATAGVAATIRLDGGQSGGNGAATISSVHVGSGSSAITFGTRNSSSNVTERVRIDNSGNVGIGTTSPQTPLHVEGITRITESNNTAFYGGNYVRLFGSQTFLFRNTIGNSIAQINLNGNSYFNGGNVGIGTTSPSGALHVYSSGSERLLVGSDVNVVGSTDLQITGASRRMSFTSGTGTIRTTTSNSLILQTNSTTAITIDSSQNVGIGTTSPSAKLDVAGSALDTYIQVRSQDNVVTSVGESARVRFSAADTTFLGHIGYIYRSSSQYGTHVSSRDYIHFETNNDISAKVTIDNSGNVGIGTASPATKLHVVGTAETRLRVGSSNASSNVVLELRDENSPTGQGTVITYNNATGETYFNNALSTATTDFHFQSGEYGTASDFFALSDAGGNSIVQLSTATGDAFITYEDAINELAIASDGDLRLTTPTDQDVFYISSGGNIDMTQAGGVVDMGGNLIVDGQVGIGTTSPSEKLHVVGTARFDSSIKIENSGALVNTSVSAVSTGLEFLVDGSSAPQRNITFSNAGSIRVIINNDGNLGIGTTAPQQLLHIKGATNAFMMLEADTDTGIAGCYYKSEDTDDTMNRTKGFFGWQGQTAFGNGYFTMWLDTAEDNGTVTSSEEKFRWERDGDFHADGDVIAYSTTTPSDARLKKDVSTIENASEKVAKLRGVEYTWNTGSREGKREIGLIAQEVEAVVPEVVTERALPLMTGTAEEYKTVDYERLIALLIESNKEMQNRINELEKKVYGSPK